MKVKISSWGNSTAIRLPKAVVGKLGLKPGQELDIVEGDEARLKRVRKIPREMIEERVAEMMWLGPENEPPALDWGILPIEWAPDDGPGPDEWEDETAGSR